MFPAGPLDRVVDVDRVPVVDVAIVGSGEVELSVPSDTLVSSSSWVEPDVLVGDVLVEGLGVEVVLLFGGVVVTVVGVDLVLVGPAEFAARDSDATAAGSAAG